ncbi:MAG: single-stranded DNA-binding protein [Actinomycetota bacterium]|nr:single-stranded DNA-binding protein [Actinomycetota bacterium]
MANLNRVILIGNLTRDPEMRFIPAGTNVTNFGIAVNRRWTNKAREKVDTADFFNVVCWGKLAELVSQNITKGTPVAVDGRLQYRAWETADGQKRSTVEIVAENVQFLGKTSPGSEKGFEPDIDSVENEIDLEEDIPF